MTTDTRTRADMCPGVWRPWHADDGLLVRLRLLGGRVPTAALRRLSEVSREFGDGRIYLTRRANLQLRGLPAEGADLARPAVTALESTCLIPTRTHELVRNVLASPQTGLAGGRVDLRPVMAHLDELLCAAPELGRLPGRFLFTLDDGRGDLLYRLTGSGKRGTDLGCVALGDGEAQLRVGEHWGTVVSTDALADRLAELATAFFDARGTKPDAAWHIRELAKPLREPVDPDPRIPDPAPPLPYGDVPGGTHVPAEDGALTPAHVQYLVEKACGGTDVVVTPWCGVLVPEVSA
ncbi:nitrite reductase [Candidatus Mycobacterium wuenschmannii]|uniref:Nitrite reductase n=1 Tax=Candidatus Mycobacterium wuenschmannii TaxID=3027808 RepID=A0ABY8W322_9MYCO|nr:nitrite reductase [Candidatus Mycobacterium wuenschmannii]WIM89427.1 nitrite reductase [Candidatus Mycobacterium wuenschmannii]